MKCNCLPIIFLTSNPTTTTTFVLYSLHKYRLKIIYYKHRDLFFTCWIFSDVIGTNKIQKVWCENIDKRWLSRDSRISNSIPNSRHIRKKHIIRDREGWPAFKTHNKIPISFYLEFNLTQFLYENGKGKCISIPFFICDIFSCLL